MYRESRHCGAAAAVAGIVLLLGCVGSGTDTAGSKCGYKVEPAWANLALNATPTLPAVCPIKVKPSGVQPPVNFAMTVYDQNNNLSSSHQLVLDIRNAFGVNVHLTQHGFSPQAHCNGCLGVEPSVSYTPATVLYDLANGRTSDTAHAFIVPFGQTLLGDTRMTVNLTYIPEGNPSLLAPASHVWGSPLSFGLSTDSIRRPATVVWSIDGQYHATATVPWTVAVDWRQYNFPVGTHQISANVTTGTGKVVTVSKTVEILLPNGCGGGGGGGAPIPLRAPPPAESSKTPRVPQRQSQPCP